MTSADDKPGWKPLTALYTKDERPGQLRAAFLTTYDPPNPDVLIEHYLPGWLGLQNSFRDEGRDRVRFFAELEDALRRLKGRFSIVSSAGDSETKNSSWIWNYIRCFEVGVQQQAVQHAKLWMFHRGPAKTDAAETLEIVVSSANLTHDGLRGQIQAGWRCVVDLDSRGSSQRRKSWNLLPEFLEKLAATAAMSCNEVVKYWTDLLGRCERPNDVNFIASVPGKHLRGTLAKSSSAWGAAGLRACLSGKSTRKMAAMVPTIGHWNDESFRKWAKFCEIEPKNVSVAWLSQKHPWANRLQLDAETETALTKLKIRWLEIPPPDGNDWQSPLCDKHESPDPRWSHAKRYLLTQGNRKQLLITSANLSQSAWGMPTSDGGLDIRNFEFGVLLQTGDPFLCDKSLSDFARATSSDTVEQFSEQPIAWLNAEWNGEKLTIQCRTAADNELASEVAVSVAREVQEREPYKSIWTNDSSPQSTQLKWPKKNGVPLFVSVSTISGDSREIAVHDIRDNDDHGIFCTECDDNLLLEELVRLIEERYGRSPVSSSSESASQSNSVQDFDNKGDDYSVLAYVDARRRFQIIDNWSEALTNSDDHARRFVLSDAKRIAERWQKTAQDEAVDRGVRIAARVAVEELEKRRKKSQ